MARIVCISNLWCNAEVKLWSYNYNWFLLIRFISLTVLRVQESRHYVYRAFNMIPSAKLHRVCSYVFRLHLNNEYVKPSTYCCLSRTLISLPLSYVTIICRSTTTDLFDPVEIMQISLFIPCWSFMMMISGATAQTGPWPPFAGFMIVL
jgi:hypothetical protein